MRGGWERRSGRERPRLCRSPASATRAMRRESSRGAARPRDGAAFVALCDKRRVTARARRLRCGFASAQPFASRRRRPACPPARGTDALVRPPAREPRARRRCAVAKRSPASRRRAPHRSIRIACLAGGDAAPRTEPRHRRRTARAAGFRAARRRMRARPSPPKTGVRHEEDVPRQAVPDLLRVRVRLDRQSVRVRAAVLQQLRSEPARFAVLDHLLGQLLSRFVAAGERRSAPLPSGRGAVPAPVGAAGPALRSAAGSFRGVRSGRLRCLPAPA